MQFAQTSGSRLLKLLAIGFLVLLANSSYLAAFDYPNVFYILNLGLAGGMGWGWGVWVDTLGSGIFSPGLSNRSPLRTATTRPAMTPRLACSRVSNKPCL